VAAKSKSAEQLTLALDESTPEETLYFLWTETKSVKVRKAIARNPNAGGKVLKEAARLYLEDVLENPSFSMLSLFSEDGWVKKIGEVYADPDEHISKRNVLHSGNGRTTIDRDLCCWAALLSPKLTPFSLNIALQHISGERLKRALTNPDLPAKIRKVYVDALKSPEVWKFSLSSILSLHKRDIIDNDHLFEGLSNYGVGSVSCSKSDFSAFLKKLSDNYVKSKKKAP
jgi:hypothetical protein